MIALAATKMGYQVRSTWHVQIDILTYLCNQALLISPRVSRTIVQDLLEQTNASALIFDSMFASVADEMSKTINVETFQFPDLIKLIQEHKQVNNFPYDGSWNTLRSTPAVVRLL